MHMTRANKAFPLSGGFSVIELIIAMALFAIVIVSASNIFIPVIGQSKQQSRITETQMEGIIGLDILRRDIEGAGYGIPWNAIGADDTDGDGNVWEHLPNYAEALSDTSATVDPSLYNDATRDADGDGLIGEAPRGILSGDNLGINNSDYLVIKSVSVASSSVNDAAHKWTSILTGNEPKEWNNLDEDINDNDLVTVMRPVASGDRFKELIVANAGGGLSFFTAFSQTAFPPEFSPFQPNENFLIFGVSSTADSLRMPFNRADYFIGPGAPARCAPNTGVLFKAALNHDSAAAPGSNGRLAVPAQAILDCVADFQVVYGLDTDGDQAIDTQQDDVSGMEAEVIRAQVKNVSVFILAHEGQVDTYYTYDGPDDVALGNSLIKLSDTAGADWDHYRWKIYTLILKTENLE